MSRPPEAPRPAPAARHVIAVALGSFGDVHPVVGVALALQRRGHTVDFIANPLYQSLLDASGLRLRAVGAERDFLDVIDNPKMWRLRHGVRILSESLILPYMRPTFELIERLRRPDTILMAPVTAFGARIANEVFGLPLATLDLQPVLFRSELDSPGLPLQSLSRVAPLGRLLRRAVYWSADALFFDPALSRPTNAFRAEFGLEPIRRLFHDWVHSPDRTIGLFPDWYGAPQPDWPASARTTGFPVSTRPVNAPIPRGWRSFSPLETRRSFSRPARRCGRRRDSSLRRWKPAGCWGGGASCCRTSPSNCRARCRTRCAASATRR